MSKNRTPPVVSFETLRSRVERLLRERPRQPIRGGQLALDFPESRMRPERLVIGPHETISDFLDFLTDVVPDGDIYLFGGLLRDLALLGKNGFNSDIDLVVEGSWQNCVPYIEDLGARRNKFGGYRLQIGRWPVDIWNAEETWAITQGLVAFNGVGSLTKTTVLNWDAILMNWRTRQFVARARYLDEIRAGILDIVLEKNPDPLGMTVRVLRHLCMKDAVKITPAAADYLASSSQKYSFRDVKMRELRSFGNTVIPLPVYQLFENYANAEGLTSRSKMGIAAERLKRELELELVPDFEVPFRDAEQVSIFSP